MTPEVIEYLNCRPGKVYADCTLGGSGHARAILEKIQPGGRLVGIDRDQAALANAKQCLGIWAEQTELFRGNFTRLPEFAEKLGLDGLDGIIADLGLSLYQIEACGRGFSFRRDEELDMRMDEDTEIRAADLIRELDERELTRIFWEFGEEKYARLIAKEIVRHRKKKDIRTSGQLAETVCTALGPSRCRRQAIHPATRVFMALRIAVNRELENLKDFMAEAPKLLRPGGRICIISFHSLEDRIVKHAMKSFAQKCTCPPDFPLCICGHQASLKILTRKVCLPSEAEIQRNPMARSAKLRAAEKIPAAAGDKDTQSCIP